MRNWQSVVEKLHHVGLKDDEPVLVVAECVFVYMPPAQSNAILQWSASRIAKSAVCYYENLRLNDQFGLNMVEAVVARGVNMEALDAYPTLEAHRIRLDSFGMQVVQACDMK